VAGTTSVVELHGDSEHSSTNDLNGSWRLRQRRDALLRGQRHAAQALEVEVSDLVAPERQAETDEPAVAPDVPSVIREPEAVADGRVERDGGRADGAAALGAREVLNR
jgi:hypothetical protein